MRRKLALVASRRRLCPRRKLVLSGEPSHGNESVDFAIGIQRNRMIHARIAARWIGMPFGAKAHWTRTYHLPGHLSRKHPERRRLGSASTVRSTWQPFVRSVGGIKELRPIAVFLRFPVARGVWIPSYRRGGAGGFRDKWTATRAGGTWSGAIRPLRPAHDANRGGRGPAPRAFSQVAGCERLCHGEQP